MTEPAVLLVAMLTLVVAAAAAWFSVPTPPALDGRAWFHAVLVHRLRRQGLRDEQIAALVPRLGQAEQLETLLWRPHAQTAVPGSALAELLERLGTLERASERWSVVVRESAAYARDSRLDALGRPHDPARWLGPTTGWSLLDGDDGLLQLARAAEQRQEAVWRWVEGANGRAPRLGSRIAAEEHVLAWSDGIEQAGMVAALQAWAVQLHGLRDQAWPWWAWQVVDDMTRVVSAWMLAISVERVVSFLKDALPETEAERRLLVGGSGVGVPLLLRALRADMDLRDRVIGVVSSGGAIHGLEDDVGPLGRIAAEDWMDANFRHERMDVEVIRLIPYVSVQWLGLPLSDEGRQGLSVARARFGEPGYVGGALLQPLEPDAIESVDLGVLVHDQTLPVQEVADALRFVVAMWALTRR